MVQLFSETYSRCDKIVWQLQVSEIGTELGRDDLQKVVHFGHVQFGDLRPERDEAPEPGVLGDHVPFFTDQSVLTDLTV